MNMANFKDKVFGGGKKAGSPNKGDGGKKVLAGMLFAAACFIAIFVLLEFHEVYWVVGIACALLMGAAYWFLDSMFGDKDDFFDEFAKAQEELDRAKEEDREKADAEFKKKIEAQVASLDKTSRAMFEALQRSADIQENHLTKMQIKIDKVIIDQNAGVKTMIKFNRENARQMALSEKATLEEIATRIPAARRVEMAPEVPDDYVPDDDLFEEEEEPEMDDISLDALDSLIPNEEPEEVVDTVVDLNAFEEPPEGTVEETVMDEPVFSDLVFDEPIVEEEVIDGPVIDESVAEEPIEETVTEEPAVDEIVEEAVTEEVAIEEPVIEEPVIEEPVIDEPVADEIAEEFAEEPVTEEPVIEESVIEEATAEETDLGDLNLDELLAGMQTDETPTGEAVSEEAAGDPFADLLAGIDIPEEPAADEVVLEPDPIPFPPPIAEPEPEPAPEPIPEPEPAPEPEPVKKDTSEAALASATGVDLSNPNANLSADDIAKLFEAAKGN